MRSPKGVIRAFFTLGEPGQTVFLAKGADAVPALGQDLMGVALVPYIPYDLVARRVEHGM